MTPSACGTNALTCGVTEPQIGLPPAQPAPVLVAVAATVLAAVRGTKVLPAGQSAAVITLVMEMSYSGVTEPSASLQPAYADPRSSDAGPSRDASLKVTYTYGPSAALARCTSASLR
eukprot:scaffold66117_cov72-Phaeocystis_antarctica.AAC.1